MRGGVTLLVVAAVGAIGALALADALRSDESSAPSETVPTSTGPTETTAVIRQEVASVSELKELPRRLCGSLRTVSLLEVEVVAGDASCHEARRVVKAHYTGRNMAPWRCHGSEANVGCEKPPGQAIRAHFNAGLSPSEEAKRLAIRWARAFAAHDRGCRYMNQPACERIYCEHAGGYTIPDCTPITIAYRRSLEDARVEEIASKGGRIAARFSNGEIVELLGFVGGPWMVHRIRWKAGSEIFE